MRRPGEGAHGRGRAAREGEDPRGPEPGAVLRAGLRVADSTFVFVSLLNIEGFH